MLFLKPTKLIQTVFSKQIEEILQYHFLLVDGKDLFTITRCLYDVICKQFTPFLTAFYSRGLVV